jgi:hypothetical protein
MLLSQRRETLTIEPMNRTGTSGRNMNLYIPSHIFGPKIESRKNSYNYRNNVTTRRDKGLQ